MSRANGQTCSVNFFRNSFARAALLAAGTKVGRALRCPPRRARSARPTIHDRRLSFGQIALLAAGLALAGAPAARADGPPEANTNRPAVLVLGDSLAAGLGVDPSEAYPALLQKKIDAAGLNFTIINGGVSGDTSAGGLRRLPWYLGRKIDVLFLELGANDGLRGVPPAATRANLQAIIDAAKTACPGIKIVIAGMRLPPNLGQDYTDAFEKIFPALARENHAALVPFLLEGVGGKPELNAPDQIHPTAEGHKIVAENVWKILKPALEAKP
jgi:acyl-CoA thioesterase-1